MIHAARPLSEGLVARAVKLATGIPYWCYVHGEDVNVAKSSRELRALTRSVLAGSQRVIANSSFTKDLLRQDWMVSEDKILLMNPGVDTKQYTPSDGQTDRPAEWRGKTVLLTAGRLQERKGHDTVIRSIATLLPQFPDLLYVIVGGGDRLEYLKQLASESQVSDHVVFVGEIDDDELLRYFQHCDVFVLANRQVGYDVEGFGIVLIEAQACGKPVIAGASGGTRDTMVRGRTGFLANCEDPKELCKIISEELDTAEKRVQIGERARKHMVENFDWQVLGRIAADHFNSDVSLADRTSPNSL
jgi:phosphatidylinositol alpha-1,6-mannosyltransferase